MSIQIQSLKYNVLSSIKLMLITHGLRWIADFKP
jgi:hypothetical protein